MITYTNTQTDVNIQYNSINNKTREIIQDSRIEQSQLDECVITRYDSCGRLASRADGLASSRSRLVLSVVVSVICMACYSKRNCYYKDLL